VTDGVCVDVPETEGVTEDVEEPVWVLVLVGDAVLVRDTVTVGVLEA